MVDRTDLKRLADGTYTVVGDAIEDGRAQTFLEQDGEEISDAAVPADRLPEDGRHADAILAATIGDGRLIALRYLPAEEATQRSAF